MRDAAYSSVTQNVDLHLENYDPFTDESCPPSWQEKFKFTSRTLLKEDLKAFDDAIKNLKNFGLKRRHLFTVTHDFSLQADDMFDALFPSRRVRCDNEEISKHLLYRLVSLDKTLQSDKALREKISNLIGNGLMNFDMLLKVYGEIIKQAIQEKKSAEFTEELQTLAQKNFSTWLNQWQSFCENQSEENTKKLKTFISCGIPHKLSKAVARKEQQVAAERQQTRYKEQQKQAEISLALKNQPPSKNLQYSNPYVEAIFRRVSKNNRWFFLFDRKDRNAVPDCIHIGLTTNGDSKKTAQEMQDILSTELFQNLSIKKLDIRWEDELDTRNPSAINELFEVATALPHLESICIYSGVLGNNIAREDQIDTLLKILQDNPRIRRLSFRSLLIQESGYKKLIAFWQKHSDLQIDIDESNKLKSFYRRTNRPMSDNQKTLLQEKSNRSLVAPTEEGEYIEWEDVAPLAEIKIEDYSILEMERNSSAEQKSPVSDVLPENEPPSSTTPRIFDITRLEYSLLPYKLEDLTDVINGLEITLGDENRYQLVEQLIRVLGIERIQFFQKYNKLDALIDFVRTGRFSLCEIEELDKTSNQNPLSRLSSLLAPYNNPLISGEVLSTTDIQNIVDYETHGLNPATRFSTYSPLTPEQQKLIGHLQLFFDTVIVPSIKERIRLTQDWQQLRTTDGSKKEALIVEQKMGLFTDFIQKSCERLSTLSVTIENSIKENKEPQFKAQDDQYLKVVHSHRDAMNKTAGFAVSTDSDNKVLQEARHPVTFRVRQFFAAIASIPAGILGILTGFQLYSVNDMRKMFATKSHATLFTAQSKAQEIENKLLDKPRRCFDFC